MRTTALFLVALIALGASPARAEETVVKQQRGFLSGLGIGLLIGGLAGVGAGVAGVAGANEATTLIAAYGTTFPPEETQSVAALQRRISDNTLLAGFGFVGGGLALIAGIVCLAVDSPVTKVAFVPTSQGGVLVFSGRF